MCENIFFVTFTAVYRDAPFDFWGGGPRLFLKKNVCFQISVKKIYAKNLYIKNNMLKDCDNFNC